ncbi:hypothetical protein C1H46_012895 [Malus baccata]|uniref:Secreted protein n=1 Tax=Malus baccata TaxID=106549 RepID=A0A540MRX5_MALBA|nr:hypothetical protein C1H46_012895 [Malus baccata]
MSAWLFGFIGVILKLLVSHFRASHNYFGGAVNRACYCFVEHAAASSKRVRGSGQLEAISSKWLVLCLRPFLKGLFGTGKYEIPQSTIFFFWFPYPPYQVCWFHATVLHLM